MRAKDYRQEAREKLKGNWKNMVLITLIANLIMVPTFIVGIILPVSIFVIPPLSFGLVACAIKVSRDEKIEIRDLFISFKKCYWTSIRLYFCQSLFLTLWSLIPVVGGIFAIIKSVSYSLSFHALYDYGLGACDCITESRLRLTGEDWNILFALRLSFIGWILLSIVSCGILLPWVSPYMDTSVAVFYNKLVLINQPPVSEEPIQAALENNTDNANISI